MIDIIIVLRGVIIIIMGIIIIMQGINSTIINIMV